MERPNLEILEHIDAVLKDLKETEEAITFLKKRLNDIVAPLASEPYDIRLKATAYLYWMIPVMPVKVLAQALIGEPNIYKFLQAIGPIPSKITCKCCGELIPIASRSERQSKFRSDTCWPCRNAEQKRYVDWLEELKKSAELQRLKTMPYRDYLNTNEWQERRKRHLTNTGHRCQVCNSSDETLDVHHRSYEHRGEEQFMDLIVLCRSCHELFHSQGKLHNHPIIAEEI